MMSREQIDLVSKYETLNGCSVRIYAIDGDKDFPVHGAVQIDGIWHPHSWEQGGNFHYTFFRKSMNLKRIGAA